MTATVTTPPRTLLPGRVAAPVLLVLAPALVLTEAVLSPLHGGSTRSELGHIAAHQDRFTISVLCGIAGVLLLVPAFLGVAQACVGRAPVAARLGGWASVLAMGGFMAVRGVQVVQLQTVRDGLDTRTSASLIDHAGANPLGVPVLVVFLLGSLIGTTALAVAVWRAGLPRPAALMLGAFQLVDLALPGHVGTAVAHAVLLVALAWIGFAIRTAPTTNASAGSARANVFAT